MNGYARKCVVVGRDFTKIAFRTSAAIDGGIAGFRLGQGIDAFADGNTSKAFGYFGEATLRLLGVSVNAVAWLKNKPKCFVAGTLVHTENGPTPIEQIQAGDRVWALDRTSQAWQLAVVRRTFENVSTGSMATALLVTGDAITGTDGHPVWVVEGEDLAGRGRPDHGADEPAGPTPGRWVPLGALKVGDALLTRAGVTRVVTLELFSEPQPVYNLEVEGLHAYAVGASGLLAHNGGPAEGCNLGSVTPALKGTAKKPDTPAVALNGPASATPATRPTKAKPPVSEAPPAKSVAPSVEEGTKSKYYRDRPRSNKDCAYPSVSDGAVQRKDFVAADKAATDAAWANYDAAMKAGTNVEKRNAGRALGEAGADAYMTNRGASLEYTGLSPNGNFDLDKVYKQGDRLIIVEAKGPGAKPTARRAGVDAEGNVQYAMQGSRQYLDDTLTAMKNGTDEMKTIAGQLEAALAAGKLDYMTVWTRRGRDRTSYFSVQKYKLSGGGQ